MHLIKCVVTALLLIGCVACGKFKFIGFKPHLGFVSLKVRTPKLLGFGHGLGLGHKGFGGGGGGFHSSGYEHHEYHHESHHSGGSFGGGKFGWLGK